MILLFLLQIFSISVHNWRKVSMSSGAMLPTSPSPRLPKLKLLKKSHTVTQLRNSAYNTFQPPILASKTCLDNVYIFLKSWFKKNHWNPKTLRRKHSGKAPWHWCWQQFFLDITPKAQENKCKNKQVGLHQTLLLQSNENQKWPSNL